MVDGIGGRFLRTFRKKNAPAMVTSADFEKANEQEQCVQGKYNVFGISLVDAFQVNEEANKELDIYASISQSRLCDEISNNEYFKFVPIMILKCIDYINNHGLGEEGLYRVSGSSNDIQELRNGFSNTGPSYNIPESFDVHAVTNLVKAYCRELPEDVLPVTTRHTFLSYQRSEVPTDLAVIGSKNFSLFTQEEEDMNPNVIPTQILQEILQELSPCNFALVQAFTFHFQKIVNNSSVNKMSLSNLGIILCHTLRIHKSVFHALVLKGPGIWDGISPSQASTTRSINYESSKILSYEDENISSGASALSAVSSYSSPPFTPEIDATSSAFSSDDTQTSISSCASSTALYSDYSTSIHPTSLNSAFTALEINNGASPILKKNVPTPFSTVNEVGRNAFDFFPDLHTTNHGRIMSQQIQSDRRLSAFVPDDDCFTTPEVLSIDLSPLREDRNSSYFSLASQYDSSKEEEFLNFTKPSHTTPRGTSEFQLRKNMESSFRSVSHSARLSIAISKKSSQNSFEVSSITSPAASNFGFPESTHTPQTPTRTTMTIPDRKTYVRRPLFSD